MNKLERLKTKIIDDYKKYREQEIAKGVEACFNNSYYNAICGEWECYLSSWLDVFFEENTIDILLELDNIFETLTNYAGNRSTIEFTQDEFHYIFEEFTENYETVN